MDSINSKPLLSIIIPIYNVQSYLSRCLNSILSQSYTNLEIICVDDGSTDDSGKIADQYAMNDSRVQVIHKRNGGLVSARKAGVEQATGEYATYVDSDDWIEAGMYEDLMGLMLEYNADLVTSGIIRDYGTHTVLEAESAQKQYYHKDVLGKIQERLISTERFFERTVSVAVWNKIYRSDLLRKYQKKVDNRISIGEDVAVVYPYILNADSIVVSGKNYYHYCIRDNSVMSRRKCDEMPSVDIMLGYIQSEFQRKHNTIINTDIQFEFLYLYFKLLKETESIIKYDKGILYPFGEIEKFSKVVVYGVGRFGEGLLKTLKEKYEFEIVGWADKQVKEGVIDPNEISCLSYDKIIIAILIADIADEVERNLLAMGIPKDKIMRIDPLLISRKHKDLPIRMLE